MHTKITQLPDSIGNLIYLNKINLYKNMELIELPRSIVSLSNLRTLMIVECNKLRCLPDSHHSRSPHDFSDDGSRRFGNLDLRILCIVFCLSFEKLPASLCRMKNLETLDLAGCKCLSELPEQIGNLQSLTDLRLTYTNIRSLPISLYRLALRKDNEDFLPSPWKQRVIWMQEALDGTRTPYKIHVGRSELQIRILPETTIPFAEEHLDLLTQALRATGNGILYRPQRVFVSHEGGEQGIDLGGLTRNFFNRTLLPNLALQTKDDSPIFKYSTETRYYLLEKERGAAYDSPG